MMHDLPVPPLSYEDVGGQQIADEMFGADHERRLADQNPTSPIFMGRGPYDTAVSPVESSLEITQLAQRFFEFGIDLIGPRGGTPLEICG